MGLARVVRYGVSRWGWQVRLGAVSQVQERHGRQGEVGHGIE